MILTIASKIYINRQKKDRFHPFKGTCQEKKVFRKQERAFFLGEQCGCENGLSNGSSEQPPLYRLFWWGWGRTKLTKKPVTSCEVTPCDLPAYRQAGDLRFTIKKNVLRCCSAAVRRTKDQRIGIKGLRLE